MRKLLFVLAVLGLLIPLAGAQSNHNPVYLVGGYGTSSTYTYYPNAVFMYDATGATPTLTKVCDTPPYTTKYPSLCMDYDNKNFLMNTSGTSSSTYQWNNSLVHYDMGTSTWTSLWDGRRVSNHAGPGSYKYSYPYNNVFVDQNGDYLFSIYEYDRHTSPTTTYYYTRAVYKYDRVAGTTSTVITTTQAGIYEYFYNIDRDIDSGKVLISGGRSQTSPTTMRYAVHTISPEGGYNPASFGDWNDGSVYGWYNYSRGVEQNVRNGNLERPYYRGYRVYQLKPGSASMTTIATIPTTSLPYTTFYGYSGKFDLQTAKDPEYILNGYYSSRGAWAVHYDVNTWTYKSTDTFMTTVTHPQYRYFYNYQFEFYQGRNIQTVADPKVANKWDILLSVPHLPKMPYVLAAGASGVRPGIALPDGRNINLNFDVVVFTTVNNLLPGIWNGGPGVLDANGEAKGSLDLSAFPIPATGVGQPLWIVMAVLDPKAPSGFAYLPDTYVMRL
jgi:hypothetical protein